MLHLRVTFLSLLIAAGLLSLLQRPIERKHTRHFLTHSTVKNKESYHSRLIGEQSSIDLTEHRMQVLSICRIIEEYGSGRKCFKWRGVLIKEVS